MLLIAIGPGLYRVDSFWMYDFFSKLCHQDPSRSFTVNGVQMAVCSRCLGIYTLLAVGWLAMPLFLILKITQRQALITFLLVAIGINLIDILGNYLEIWTNTLHSRFVLGSLFGLSIATVLSTDFFLIKKVGTHG